MNSFEGNPFRSRDTDTKIQLILVHFNRNGDFDNFRSLSKNLKSFLQICDFSKIRFICRNTPYDNIIIMYKALYDFSIEDENGLSFHVNDKFTVLDNGGPHWWLVQNGTGQVGFVPGNYLATDEVS